ncbi:hypothetical protein WICPIJ_003602 [Wickerhamomyces pijperi]|uniref:Purine nucleoside phosphorylase n=1 Tax=Wickerhamomyces pijperi TaxID=599730 RepID=A0A9P8TNJ5_WICPI|nr:hypothetical protein WICPIJ_003602 [Wickerhamomyces pijperi]
MSDLVPPEQYLQQIQSALAYLENELPRSHLSPKSLIICGSGLGGLSSLLQDAIDIPYSSIPNFQTSTVPGHEGKLSFGFIGSNRVAVVCMVGRLHFYEGYTFQETTFPIRVLSKLGVETLVVTNAAGGVRPGFKPGDLMVIWDHLNIPGFAGYHPLRGPNLAEFGVRFQPLSDAYDLKLRQLFFRKCKELQISRSVHEGTYFYASGPTFESRAEVRAIHLMGGDAVGMSTVPEVIVARHSGLRVLALSLITNAAVIEYPPSGMDEQHVDMAEGIASHAEVLEYANEASKDVERIIEAVVNDF